MVSVDVLPSDKPECEVENREENVTVRSKNRQTRRLILLFLAVIIILSLLLRFCFPPSKLVATAGERGLLSLI